MQVNVRFLDNLKLEASFDDFVITTDQPVRYKGDGTAPSPFDYFLASSALCAAYFVKVYCKARNIPTEDIRLSQNNVISPENRYQQAFDIKVELPEYISEKDREGILRSIDRCTVKKVVQTGPEFLINPVKTLGSDNKLRYELDKEKRTKIVGKDLSLEETIENMTSLIAGLGINLEIASWRNIVPHVWSVHLRDADSPICYTNGKGSTKDAALASALGEYIERISNNYFYNDYYLGQNYKTSDSFVHYPNEKWFVANSEDDLPAELLDSYTKAIYNPSNELRAKHLFDTNSANTQRGICAIPYVRQSDQKEVYFPVSLIGNLFVSNGMSAGNTKEEARVQCLSEIFERAVKNEIILNEYALPDVPSEVLARFPKIVEGIEKLEAQGFPILVKDASLGGKYPVMCVTLMNPKTGGVYASFGAHPKFEVALERSLTELMQGRSFEGLNDMPAPSFNSEAVSEHNNIIDHFIDSAGVVSWKFFAANSDFEFNDWNFSGTTKEEFDYLMSILNSLEKEVYIADYPELGASACRILVPAYSEIYEVEDLIWDNHNRALDYREDILNIHHLDEAKKRSLLERLEESQIDDYTPITELIGIAFEETSVWGQLTIGELKGLICLSIGDLEIAKDQFEMLLNFNDNTNSRREFFRAINTILDIAIDPELEFENYIENVSKLYGTELTKTCIDLVQGKTHFYGLDKTNFELEGLDKHQRLVESFDKLHRARAKFYENR